MQAEQSERERKQEAGGQRQRIDGYRREDETQSGRQSGRPHPGSLADGCSALSPLRDKKEERA